MDKKFASSISLLKATERVNAIALKLLDENSDKISWSDLNKK